MKIFIIMMVLGVGFGLNCPAQNVATKAEWPEIPKPSVLQRRQLCDQIDMQAEDEDPESPYEYKFERLMDEIAHVDRTKDSAEVVNQKIRDVWTNYNDSMVCDTLDFDVANGYMLKYAVSKKYSGFIYLAVNEWKVPLNRVDPFDGRTVLDYVFEKWKDSRGTINEAPLKRYYTIMKKAGAIHEKKYKDILDIDK